MLYTKDGIIRDGNRIVIKKDGFQVISPTEEMILADGWEPYTPPVVEPTEPEPTLDDQIRELILDQYNKRTDISDEDALKRPLLVYDWDTYIGGSLTTGQIVSYDNTLYRVRQDIASVLDGQSPSLDTAALYEAIEVEASGTIDDPIAYVPPMEIFSGKYYMQDDVLYLCTRDSGTALSHDLSALVGLYVEVA